MNYQHYTGKAVAHIIAFGCHSKKEQLRSLLAKALRVTREQLGTREGRRENKWFKRHCQYVSGWPNK